MDADAFRSRLLTTMQEKSDEIMDLALGGVAFEAWLQAELWMALWGSAAGEDGVATEVMCYGKRVDLAYGRDEKWLHAVEIKVIRWPEVPTSFEYQVRGVTGDLQKLRGLFRGHGGASLWCVAVILKRGTTRDELSRQVGALPDLDGATVQIEELHDFIFVAIVHQRA